jgi:hypothetical protein
MSNKSTTDDLAGTVPFAAAQAAKPNTVTLETPIKRGDQVITAVSVRKPASGELRGVQLASLLQLDVAALITVLPRVTAPTLTTQELNQLDPADLLAFGGEVVGFFTTKAERALLPESPLA